MVSSYGNDSSELWKQSASYAESSNQSMKRSAACAADTVQLGRDTLSKVKKQGEKLERSHKNLDTIHEDLDEAKEINRSTASIFGDIKNTFTSKESKKRPKRKETASEEKSEEKKEDAKAKPAASGPLLFESSNPDSRRVNAYSEETEKYLDDVSSRVNTLKEISLAMGAKLDKQNESLDLAAKDTDFACQRIKTATSETHNLR